MNTKLLTNALFIIIFLLVNYGVSEAENSPFGIHIDPWFSVNDLVIYAYKDVGVKNVRLVFLWQEIEKQKGTFDWANMDRQVKLLKDANINILALLYGTPTWARKDEYLHTPASPPRDISFFESFVREAVRRYKPGGILSQEEGWGNTYGIRYWEIWNEPDLKIYWAHDDTPDEYLRLLKAAYKTIKNADIEASVINGGIAMVSAFKGPKVFNLFYEVGAKGYFDIVCFHFYPDPMTNYREKISEIRELKEIMGKYGDTAKALWDSEGGGPGHGTEPPDEKIQCKYMIRFFVSQLAEGVEKIFWFKTMDLDGSPDPSVNFYSGIVGKGGKIKLGYYTYKLMTEKLDGSNFDNIETLIEGKDNIYAYRFMKNGKPIYVLWWDFWKQPGYQSGNTKVVTLQNIEASEVIITNAVPKYANGTDVPNYKNAFKTETIKVSNGTVSLKLGEDPIFLEPRVSVGLDTTAPAKIMDLTAIKPKYDSITLTWTATGDDGNIGTATFYDIRYSTSQESGWEGALQCVDEPIPKTAGFRETFIVTSLQPETTYYFAIKAQDGAGNISEISNIAVLTTAVGIDLSVEGIDVTPEYIAVGQAVTFKPLITNIGTRASIKDTTKGEFYSNGIKFSEVEIPWSIPPGKALKDVGEIEISWVPPDAGTYEVEFILKTQDELKTKNNYFKNTFMVYLGTPWDINDDGIVDIFDIVALLGHFGEKPPKEKKADINGDGVVNILDLVIVAKHFGEKKISML